MLWQVADSNLSLLASVHSARAPLSLGAAATAALEGAEVIAFEANFEVQVPMPSKFYPPAISLSGNVPAALYEDTTALAERLGLARQYLSSCRPWWAAFELMNRVLSERGFSAENGVDRQALRTCKMGGKDTFFLESNTAGLVPFARAPHPEQESSLSLVVQRTDEGVEMVASIIAAWESGSPPNLEPIYRRAIQQMPNAYSAALDGRNKQWVRHLLRLAGSRRKTVAVLGALHFVGPNSIPELLSKAARSCRVVS